MIRSHVCQCLNCKPDIIPDYDVHDPLIHFRGKCRTTFKVLNNGIDVGYTSGVTKEGIEGFYLSAGESMEDIHTHTCSSPNGEVNYSTCLELRFGNIMVIHDGIQI